MAVGPVAGSKLYIGTSETIGSPDDYLEIGEINDLGSFGRVYQEIIAQSIGTRGDRKYKGTYNDGAMAIKVNRDPVDTGQAAAIVARDSDADFNFKLTINDAGETGVTYNTEFFFKAKVMSYTVEGGGPNNIVMSTINLSLKSGSIIEVAAHN